jgi:pyridoxal phosphate enzyme (YggS family)
VDLRLLLQQRLKQVEDRLQAACRRAGRARQEVTLVAVTKTVSPAVAECLHQLGVTDLGESRPQELWHKAVLLPSSVRWHLVGHLQRNKIERTLPLVHAIHSVDSIRLLEALEHEAAAQARTLPVLLEVNASGEVAKHGLAPGELPETIARLDQLRFVQVRGLMTMAALDDDPERCRPTFVTLRRLRDDLAARLPLPHRLEHLSMGMSNDFEIAVEEGATMVRLGTILFEGLSEGPA